MHVPSPTPNRYGIVVPRRGQIVSGAYFPVALRHTNPIRARGVGAVALGVTDSDASPTPGPRSGTAGPLRQSSRRRHCRCRRCTREQASVDSSTCQVCRVHRRGPPQTALVHCWDCWEGGRSPHTGSGAGASSGKECRGVWAPACAGHPLPDRALSASRNV
jgi:hypothetical protein